MQTVLLLTALLLPSPCIADIASAETTVTRITRELTPADSLSDALNALRQNAAHASTLILHAGTYHLTAPLRLTDADNNLTLTAAPNEQVTLSGSRPLTLSWTPYKNNILQAQVPAEIKSIEQLYINNEPQILARYPNDDPSAQIFHGTAADAFSPARVATWSNPAGGYIHALHKSLWGSQHYLITDKNPDNTLQYEGGYQTNRPGPMHKDFRFVENIFEELDAPHEFFFNPKTHTLYFYPPKDFDPSHAPVEVNNLDTLIQITGQSPDKPANHIILQNLTLTHTNRTFMQTKEPILRSDWCIARIAAVILDNTENVTIDHCTLEQLGGNALLLSNFNENALISTSHIHDTGASAILVVGDPKAVRDPLVGYRAPLPEHTHRTPRPLKQNFPQNCTITDCLIHDIGQIEKQSAGVDIDIASHITISHCSIYNTPRAGINIGDGCFGGHLIESCDVFNTVLETGDHGAFNSWGRDRFWSPDRKQINQRVAENPQLPLLDAIDPITLRSNRFRCDRGWDIDLDDGSSNYLIEDNLLLHGGLKFREGYNRTARGNILFNCTFHPHVWLQNSHDTFERNLVFRPYKPIGMPKSGTDWGEKIDNNTFTDPAALAVAQNLGVDLHSTVDSEVPPTPTDFGVTDPALRKNAPSPEIPTPVLIEDFQPSHPESERTWLGAKIKSITTAAEVSAAGLPDKSGVLLLEVPPDSAAARAGLQRMDVILKFNDKPVHTQDDLTKTPVPQTLTVFRNQSEQQVTLK